MPDVFSQVKSMSKEALGDFEKLMQFPLAIGQSLISGAANAAKNADRSLAAAAESMMRPFTEVRFDPLGLAIATQRGGEIVGQPGARGQRTTIF